MLKVLPALANAVKVLFAHNVKVITHTQTNDEGCDFEIILEYETED